MFGGEKGDDLLPMIDSMKEQGKKLRPEHIEPDLWIASQPLIDLFWDFNSWRKTASMGVARIDLSDLEYYCKFYGRVISYFEVLAIRRLDDLFLKHYVPLKSED